MTFSCHPSRPSPPPITPSCTIIPPTKPSITTYPLLYISPQTSADLLLLDLPVRGPHDQSGCPFCRTFGNNVRGNVNLITRQTPSSADNRELSTLRSLSSTPLNPELGNANTEYGRTWDKKSIACRQGNNNIAAHPLLMFYTHSPGCAQNIPMAVRCY